jgi:hypothetical protein
MDIQELEALVFRYPNNQELGLVIRMKYYEMKKANENQQMIKNQLNLFDGSQQINS